MELVVGKYYFIFWHGLLRSLRLMQKSVDGGTVHVLFQDMSMGMANIGLALDLLPDGTWLDPADTAPKGSRRCIMVLEAPA